MRYYIAYGSNLNTEQMKTHCPDAKKAVKGYLNGYKLEFRGRKNNGYLTIAKAEGEKVPILVWKISKADERALDRYEGYPTFYRKETFVIENDGKTIEAMAYIMNGNDLALPSDRYLKTVLTGYDKAGFGYKSIVCAITDVQRSIIHAERMAEKNTIEETATEEYGNDCDGPKMNL